MEGYPMEEGSTIEVPLLPPGLQVRPLRRRVAGLELQGGYVHLDEPALASHGAGGARLLVEDDELEGAAVVAVLLSPDGRVIAQRRTVVGGEA
jgi:hypothetical protein